MDGIGNQERFTRQGLRLSVPVLLLVAFVALTVFAALACPDVGEGSQVLGSISGRVVASGTSNPLPGVTVTIQGRADRTSTDETGAFALSSLAPGEYTVEAALHGYRGAALFVRVGEGQVATEVSIELEPLARFLSEIVVSPSRYTLLETTPGARTTLSRDDIEIMPRFADDVLRAVRWLPGTTGEDLSAQVSIRGGAVDETLVLVDGLELYEGFHLKEIFSLVSIIDAEAIAGLELSTGGFGAEHGNRMSGVIDFSTSNSGLARTTLGLSTTNIGLLSEGSFAGGRGRWLVSARRTDLDKVIEWIDPENGLEPDFHDILAKLSYVVGNHTALSFNVLTARDRTHYVEENGRIEELLDATCTNQNVWVNIKTAWTDHLLSQTVVSAGTVDRKRAGWIDYWYQAGTVDDTRTFDYLGLKQDWTLDVGDRHLVKWGFDLRRMEASYDYSSYSIVRDALYLDGGGVRVTERDTLLDLEGDTTGVYLADRFRLSDSLVGELGVRWDRQSYLGDQQLSPRASLSWDIGPSTTVRTAWGLYHQPQLLNELQVSDGITEFQDAQRGEHRLLAIEQGLGAGLDLRVELYQKKISDVRSYFENFLNPIEIFPEIEGDRILVAAESAQASGVEIVLRKDGGRRWSWWLAYAYSKAEDEIDGEWVPRSWDQPHAANLSISFRPTPRWSLNLSGTYHSGWPTTAVYGIVVEAADGARYIYPEVGPRNGARLPDYLRVDVRASREFRLRRSVCSVFLEIMNVLNRENLGRPESFGFRILPDGTSRLSIDWEAWMPMIPSLGVRWTF